MLNLLPQSDVFVPESNNPDKVIKDINAYLNKSHCENVNVDISFMNTIDACFVSTMCSANHYINHPESKISWFVSSDLTQELTKSLTLGNSFYKTI